MARTLHKRTVCCWRCATCSCLQRSARARPDARLTPSHDVSLSLSLSDCLQRARACVAQPVAKVSGAQMGEKEKKKKKKKKIFCAKPRGKKKKSSGCYFYKGFLCTFCGADCQSFDCGEVCVCMWARMCPGNGVCEGRREIWARKRSRIKGEKEET